MGQEEIIAKRYAKGLAEHAVDSGDMEAVRRDVGLLADILDPHGGASHSPELIEFLRSPVPTQEEKLAAVGSIMEKAGVGAVCADFIGLLIRKNRITLMPRIARVFADIAGGMTGEYTAVAHTARPLSPDQARRLTEVLASVFGGVVRLHQRIEPGLLAGARITVGDKTFDGSVLGRLERLRHRLVSSGVADLKRMQAEEDEGQATA